MVLTAPRTFPAITKGPIETLQVNLGRLCNQACRHCHVDSSPARSGAHENAQADLADSILWLLSQHPELKTVDLTGGAPELNPHFRRLVREARRMGRSVLVRHNLTVQFEPGNDDLPAFFAEHGVVLFCSLPCYSEANVAKQRGNGVFEASITALKRLNAAGFGRAGSDLDLHLVYNPIGASLPPPQEALERDYRIALARDFEIEFTRLVAITNQPIHRFKEDLERKGELDNYQRLLEANFNPSTLPALMCRSALSVRWDGLLYDCDFNLVQDMPITDVSGSPITIHDVAATGGLEQLFESAIKVDSHCFACTAGCGSSCGGTLA